MTEVTQADRDLVHKVHVQVSGNYGDPAQDVADYRIAAEQAAAERERVLREALASIANSINVVGSPLHDAQVALDAIASAVKKDARQALKATESSDA